MVSAVAAVAGLVVGIVASRRAKKKHDAEVQAELEQLLAVIENVADGGVRVWRDETGRVRVRKEDCGDN